MPSAPLKNRTEVAEKTSKSSSTALLEAGPLTVEFCGGNLAAIRFRGIEVLRGISYLVRDENWGTCPATISRPVVRKGKNRCDVTFKSECWKGDNVLRYEADISMSGRSLVFTVTATPDRDFSTNRTGFVVLHPIDGVAGKSLTVTHTDGTIEKAKFPKLISPGQPFFNIRALEHAPSPGLKAHVLMEGHKFEMEDQRNWGDASYKTYVCSLLDPWPYVLRGGESFTQKITLTLKGTAKKEPAKATNVKVSTMRANARLPELGISITADDAAETLQHSNTLKQLSPSFLLGLYEAGKTDAATLKAFSAVASQSGIPLRCEIVLSATKEAKLEMAEVAAAFREAGLAPSALIVTQAHDLKSFQPTDKRPWGLSYEEMAAAARAHFPGVPIGGGMISYFTELNRKRPPLVVFDFLTHSICPIVHDASDVAVMQTLETLPHIFTTARSIMGKTPYHLGPTTIAARMNPYGKDVATNPNIERMCLAPNDPRQTGSFAAVWTLGLVAAAALAKLDSVCLGTFSGPRGVIDQNGTPLPIYAILKSLTAHCTQPIHASVSDGLITIAAGRQQGKKIFGNKADVAISLIDDGNKISLESYQVLVTDKT